MATYVVGYSLFPPLAQAYNASLEIHCPQKNTNYNTLLVIDQFYTSQLGITEPTFVPSICVQDGCASINLLTPQRGELTIYSMNGSLMAAQQVSNVSSTQVQLANWNPGIYFVHYSLSSGARGVLRFVKP